ncbi:hypothetical protein Vadar_005448 [Vaccinium darrowii]|uniref:Uncharacterized protein n=1 Tax=Vaccinium darrowii TaxID=229202 RepID=A0ACB7YTG0_9ERIC|nr:hypothetical protein Vadar_005448 [Vaccinium darrowii]
MEQTNVPVVVAKRLWNIVRVMYYMLRKGISKRKLIVDLNAMLKRGKVVGKAAIHNLVFLHHHSSASNLHSHDGHLSVTAPHDEYEFSCSDSPVHFPFHLISKRNKHRSGALSNAPEIDDDILTASTVKKVLEMPGFGRSPVVRQLRIMDSPGPSRDVGDVDGHVDEAAEEFIERFYSNLRKQL